MTALYIILAALGLLSPLFLWLFLRAPASKKAQPSGLGQALAHALEGDFKEAEQLLVQQLTEKGPHRADAFIALIAVLRAAGEGTRALQITERMLQLEELPWIRALLVRTTLDVGEPAQAVEHLGVGVPLDLELAALCRADRWSEALERYHRRCSRSSRTPALEAALNAGVAASLWREGAERSAQRAIKRALSLDPEGLLPSLVGRQLHPKGSERARLSERLDVRLSGLESRYSRGEPSLLLQEAQRRLEEGAKEEALALLRDQLDEEPLAWSMRRQYLEWLLAEGQTEACCAELTELLELLPEEDSLESLPSCSHCGYRDPEPFFICPRCDALGSMLFRAEVNLEQRPSSKGSSLRELLKELSLVDNDDF